MFCHDMGRYLFLAEKHLANINFTERWFQPSSWQPWLGANLATSHCHCWKIWKLNIFKHCLPPFLTSQLDIFPKGSFVSSCIELQSAIKRTKELEMFPLNALENHEQEPALLTCKGEGGIQIWLSEGVQRHLFKGCKYNLVSTKKSQI